jgi:hypothetical protein
LGQNRCKNLYTGFGSATSRRKIKKAIDYISERLTEQEILDQHGHRDEYSGFVKPDSESDNSDNK